MPGSIERENLDLLADQMGGQETLGRIVHMFADKLPAEIADLRGSLDAGDLDGVQSAAHRLKSSSGQLAARRLSVMLAGLELAASEGDADAAARILTEVTTEAGMVRSELDSLNL
jgi:HPt (histidine-containing phosphotransfer) domain-containing protein